MDTRYFGTNLLALDKNEADLRRRCMEANENAYYQEHTPVEPRRISRISFVVAGVLIGFATLGLWQS